jgi:histidyl-tRNA synthetase
MFKRADKVGCSKVVIVGSQELAAGIVKVKDMASGTETVLQVPIDQLDLEKI